MRSESEARREYTGATPREDFIAPGDHGSYAFAVDPSGRLAWEANDISGDHVVAILLGSLFLHPVVEQLHLGFGTIEQSTIAVVSQSAERERGDRA